MSKFKVTTENYPQTVIEADNIELHDKNVVFFKGASIVAIVNSPMSVVKQPDTAVGTKPPISNKEFYDIINK